MMRDMPAVRTSIAHNWWALALRGVFALIFGILTLVWPSLTVAVLVALFGAWALVDGVFAFVAAWQRAERQLTWWPMLLEGILGVAAGIITWVWPQITALGLLTVIGVWAIFTGFTELVAAIRLRKMISNEVWLGLAGIASVIFGALVLIFPGAGAIGIAWAIGWFAILYGVLMLMPGFRLRGLAGGESPRIGSTEPTAA
jgi:uncharacterized membrane protein HdeD (DUF308 family)